MGVDYEELVRQGATPEKLAQIFLKEYFKGKTPSFPINPFKMLRDLGIPFMLRPFSSYEGIYIPPEDENDLPVIGINLKRPIARQRYTAAHELCHHLKDSNTTICCELKPQTDTELYAEKFAAELLMPYSEFREQIELRAADGYIDFDGILEVAHYFGVSFEACLFRAAYKLRKIKGDTKSGTLKKKRSAYKPDTHKREKGLHDTVLYRQLIDAVGDSFGEQATPYMCEKFKTEYVFHDSRMEGVEIDLEQAAEIVVDLRLKKQESEFCNEKEQSIIEVAGLTFAYDYVFETADDLITIYDAMELNRQLYCTAPYPEFGGLYRDTNTLVLGAKFETVDCFRIAEEMKLIDQDVEALTNSIDQLSFSEYIEHVVRIHHRMTVVHPFRDGNGRTSRAFSNMMLIKKKIPPIFFMESKKDEYKAALKEADTTGEFEILYEMFYKAILDSYARLTDFMNAQ